MEEEGSSFQDAADRLSSGGARRLGRPRRAPRAPAVGRPPVLTSATSATPASALVGALRPSS